MEVDWNRFEYDSFGKVLPKITQAYFGKDLTFEKIEIETPSQHEGFLLNSKSRKMLAVFHQQKPVGFGDLLELESHILETGASAGLIVSASPQPFGMRFFERKPDCWFPIAVWGRKHVFAIASMNYELLSEIIPFERRASKGGLPGISKSLGKGGVLWSDIVRFVQLGIEIGQKIGVDPAWVRQRMIRHVDNCFRGTGGRNATHWQKVGSDGWFHFYKDPNGNKAVDLAIDCANHVRGIAESYRQQLHQDLKVVMGINTAQDVRLDPGGPFDDDSIIAYYLVKERFERYDTRATNDAVANLVDSSQRASWISCGKLDYPDGRQIDVYGHS
ncbi:MAG: hypothetical protein ABSC91_07445 [Candidatus Bathyarchaeia archaeon]|jgi:hypothetical protein